MGCVLTRSVVAFYVITSARGFALSLRSFFILFAHPFFALLLLLDTLTPTYLYSFTSISSSRRRPPSRSAFNSFDLRPLAFSFDQDSGRDGDVLVRVVGGPREDEAECGVCEVRLRVRFLSSVVRLLTWRSLRCRHMEVFREGVG